jgi:hypothetical protein
MFSLRVRVCDEGGFFVISRLYENPKEAVMKHLGISGYFVLAEKVALR